jgi:hypothetical protein
VRTILFVVAAAGALGGLANALLSGATLALPGVISVPGGYALVPGFLGNVFVGAVAAFISFGLYGPFVAVPILRADPGKSDSPPPPLALTLGALVGAILVGFSGGRWVTAEADKQLSQAAKRVTTRTAERLITDLDASKKALTPYGASPQKRQEAMRLLQSIQNLPPRQAYEKALKLNELTEEPSP